MASGSSANSLPTAAHTEAQKRFFKPRPNDRVNTTRARIQRRHKRLQSLLLCSTHYFILCVATAASRRHQSRSQSLSCACLFPLCAWAAGVASLSDAAVMVLVVTTTMAIDSASGGGGGGGAAFVLCDSTSALVRWLHPSICLFFSPLSGC